MSCATLSMLEPMNIAILAAGLIVPSETQPDVPEVMPKVWLPDVPLVVTARTCGAMPDLALPGRGAEAAAGAVRAGSQRRRGDQRHTEAEQRRNEPHAILP